MATNAQEAANAPDAARERFFNSFQRVPDRLARAPGRVNLIGEHTDYNGLAVLPMALQRAVHVLHAPRDDARIRLASVDPRDPPREFELGSDVAPMPAGDWSNYARAAGQALVRAHGIRRGIDALVWGDVPRAAGLSSSSALVVAVALALADANELAIAREELMELTASAERYVGVESGGMDQAVSLGGVAGHALLIEFEPLRLRAVRVPDDWRFVVADTLVGAEKAGRARAAYNARVRECRAALEGFVRAHPAGPRTWRELVARMPQAELLAAGERVLDGTLLRRFRHVVTEGARVARAVAAMERADRVGFGRLMDASHASLRGDYDVSCAELDALVAIAREGGADGARLTGAGFGGCIVALTTEERASRLLASLRERYFALPRIGPLTSQAALFVAEPSAGASVGPAPD